MTGIDRAQPQPVDVKLALLEARGLLDAHALAAVLDELAQGKALTLEHLIAVFGIEPVYHVVVGQSQQADRARLRQQFTDIFDFLNVADSRDAAAASAAVLRLITVLCEQLCSRPGWWFASSTPGDQPAAPIDERD